MLGYFSYFDLIFFYFSPFSFFKETYIGEKSAGSECLLTLPVGLELPPVATALAAATATAAEEVELPRPRRFIYINT